MDSVKEKVKRKFCFERGLACERVADLEEGWFLRGKGGEGCRWLVLRSRGDVFGKALADPDALTADEALCLRY